MDSPDSPPVQFSLTIRQPDRWMGILWLILGVALLITFFLPNYTVANMGITGLEVLERAFRPESNPRRIFDDAGFFIMLAVPMYYFLLGVFSVVCGIIALVQKQAKYAWATAIPNFFGFLFTVLGAILLLHRHSEVPFFAKLLPKPTLMYWVAMVLQLLLGLASLGYILLKRRSGWKTV